MKSVVVDLGVMGLLDVVSGKQGNMVDSYQNAVLKVATILKSLTDDKYAVVNGKEYKVNSIYISGPDKNTVFVGLENDCMLFILCNLKHRIPRWSFYTDGDYYNNNAKVSFIIRR